MTVPDWLFFIDESGTREPSDPNVDLFCYGGFLVREADAKRLSELIRQTKQQFFDGYPELKSNWLRLPREQERHYLRPYSVSSKKLRTFVDHFYGILQSFPIKVFGVVVSKSHLANSYRKAVFYPSSVAYEFLLQRIANACHEKSIEHVGIVFDDMTGKTERGNAWKELLIRQHAKLLVGRSPFYKNWTIRSGMNYSAIDKHLLFFDSKKSQCIQVADIVTYNLMRQARETWNNFDSAAYSWYSRTKPIMHKDPRTGIITGYGALCFPK